GSGSSAVCDEGKPPAVPSGPSGSASGSSLARTVESAPPSRAGVRSSTRSQGPLRRLLPKPTIKQQGVVAAIVVEGGGSARSRPMGRPVKRSTPELPPAPSGTHDVPQESSEAPSKKRVKRQVELVARAKTKAKASAMDREAQEKRSAVSKLSQQRTSREALAMGAATPASTRMEKEAEKQPSAATAAGEVVADEAVRVEGPGLATKKRPRAQLMKVDEMDDTCGNDSTTAGGVSASAALISAKVDTLSKISPPATVAEAEAAA
ncbi:unnamed protein product, partial [Sphacelaria rigidula]